MCLDPSPPNKDPADRGDACSPRETCEQCKYWTEDHSKSVSGQSSKYNDSTQFGHIPVRFKFDVRLAGGEVVVSYVCKWSTVEGDPPLTQAMKDEIKAALTTTVPAAWSDQHSLKIVDPICGEKTLPIRVKMTWDDGAANAIAVNLQKAPIRSSASARTMNLDYDDDLKDSAWTLKHEFGHVLANHDEYHYSGKSGESITLKRANGTTETLNLEPSANVMITRGNASVEKRHLYFVEIEAQELLRSKSGRDVTCEIV